MFTCCLKRFQKLALGLSLQKFESTHQNMKPCRIREKQKTNPKLGSVIKSSKRITQFFFVMLFHLICIISNLM